MTLRAARPSARVLAMSSFFATDHPFYRPLWRRIAIVVIVGFWTLIEIFVSASPFWAVIFAGVFVYCLWAFILNYKPTPEK
jgi:hypothetical protein